MNEIIKKILPDVKNVLDITYDDVLMDKKLEGIIERGISYLENIAGTSIDFEAENMDRQLLYDYCRYARSNDMESFRGNFGSDLTMLRIRNEVEHYVSEA